jgi:hypothetical protein
MSGTLKRRRRGALVLTLLAALVAAGCGSSGTLAAKALGERSKSVQSLAAEGALLAQDAAAGRSTGTFASEHSAELASAASKAESSLEATATTPALAPRLRRLAALAGKVRAALERIGGASESERRALARTLEAAAQQSERIAEGLA